MKKLEFMQKKFLNFIEGNVNYLFAHIRYIRSG